MRVPIFVKNSEYKIFGSIVIFFSVFVVNNFAWLKVSSKRFFHHKPMFKTIIPFAFKGMIGRINENITSVLSFSFKQGVVNSHSCFTKKLTSTRLTTEFLVLPLKGRKVFFTIHAIFNYISYPLIMCIVSFKIFFSHLRNFVFSFHASYSSSITPSNFFNSFFSWSVSILYAGFYLVYYAFLGSFVSYLKRTRISFHNTFSSFTPGSVTLFESSFSTCIHFYLQIKKPLSVCLVETVKFLHLLRAKVGIKNPFPLSNISIAHFQDFTRLFSTE
jgi:hypothetical protein